MSEEVKVESKHKLNKKFLIFAIIGIVLVTIVAIASIVPTSVRAKEVQEQLSLGDKYLAELNYEQAEAIYLAILKIDPKCEEAYIGLANVYIATEQYEKAEEILKKAEEQLGETQAIKEKREELERKRKEQEEKLEPTVTNTPIPTATNTPVPTATSTPEPTVTSTPIPTATSTPEPTVTSTPVPMATNTPIPTATNTPVPTATNTPEPTATSTPVPTATNTPIPTATSTPTPMPIIEGQEGDFTYIIEEGEVSITKFNKNSNIIDLTIPKEIQGYPVTSIGNSAFYQCPNLNSVIIPEGVTEIGYSVFESCWELKSVSFPNSLISIGDYAFWGCALNKIELPSKLEKIGQGAFSTNGEFSDGVSFTNVVIPNSVTYIGNFAFMGCDDLEKIEVEKDNKRYFSEDGVLYDKEKKALLCIPAGKKIEQYNILDGITNIVGGACRNCINLKSIIIPTSVVSISMGAFSSHSNLKVIVPDSVIKIENEALLRVTIITPVGSYAETYAKEHNIPYQNN